jgi:hypothetical protein
VEHLHGTGRRSRSGDGFELVLRGARQAGEDRNSGADGAAHDDPEQMGERRVGQFGIGELQPEFVGGEASLVGVQAGQRHLADDRRTHIEQVAVLVGAGTEHRVEEGDGVRLRADDLRADRRAGSGLVIRRTRPHRRASQGFVDLHQPSRTPNRFGSRSLRPHRRLMNVDQARIRVCGHGERRALGEQELGVVERKPTGVVTRPDVSELDRNELGGPRRFGRSDEHAHRQLFGFAAGAGESLPIEVVDLDVRHGLSCAGRGSRCCRRQR